MKNKIILFILISMCLNFGSIFSQQSLNASGGDAAGIGGTIAYSIGQTFYTYDSGTNGNTVKGVQQPYIISTVGIDKVVEEISFISYPNPTSDYLFLEFTNYADEKMEYQLVDFSGRVIIQKLIKASVTEIDFNNYPKGIYLIKVIKESKTIKVFQIIKN